MSTLNPSISAVNVIAGSWTNATVAALSSDDTSYATITLAGSSTGTLEVVFDLSSLPDGASVTNIVGVSLARGQSGGGAGDTWTSRIDWLSHIKDSSGLDFNDLFGTNALSQVVSISGADVKAGSFRVSVINDGFFSHTLDVDNVAAQITYTYAPSSGFFGSNF